MEDFYLSVLSEEPRQDLHRDEDLDLDVNDNRHDDDEYFDHNDVILDLARGNGAGGPGIIRRSYDALKNNKKKAAVGLGVGLAIGGGIYKGYQYYKDYKNKKRRLLQEEEEQKKKLKLDEEGYYQDSKDADVYDDEESPASDTLMPTPMPQMPTPMPQEQWPDEVDEKVDKPAEIVPELPEDDADEVDENEAGEQVEITANPNNDPDDINSKHTLDKIHTQPADTAAPAGVTVAADLLQRSSMHRYGLDSKWSYQDYKADVLDQLQENQATSTKEDQQRESKEGFDEKDRGSEGDQLLMAPVDRALPTLRPMFGVQDPAAVVPPKSTQLLSDILFDSFSVVRPGYGEGETNKLFVQQENWKDKIQYAEPLFQPGTFEGFTNTQHPLPWIWQTVKTSDSVVKWDDMRLEDEELRKKTKRQGKKGSLGILGVDIGLSSNVSTSGLKRPKESVLEPIINNHQPLIPTFDPAGIELSTRGFRNGTDAIREPMLPTLQVDMGDPHFPPRYTPLTTYLFPY